MNGAASIQPHLGTKVQVGLVQMTLQMFRSALTAKAAANMADSLCTNLKRLSDGTLFLRTNEPVVTSFREQIVAEKLHLHGIAQVREAALGALRYLCVPPMIPAEVRQVLFSKTPGAKLGDDTIGYHAETNVGTNPKRTSNEDTPGFYGLGHKVTGAACDGMGGHEKGEEASSIAANTILDRSLGRLAARIQAAVARVTAKNQGKTDQRDMMGTTVAAYDLDRLTGEGEAAAVGDSRVYIRRADGKLSLLNLPDNLVFTFLTTGQGTFEEKVAGIGLQDKLAEIKKLLFCEKPGDKAGETVLERRSPPFNEAEIELIDQLVDVVFDTSAGKVGKNVITRSLGMFNPGDITPVPFQLEPGDTVFAVTDGIPLKVDEIKGIFDTTAELSAISAKMIAAGVPQSADNASFVAVRQPTLTGELPVVNEPAKKPAKADEERTAAASAEQLLLQQILELQVAVAERETKIGTLTADVLRLTSELETARSQAQQIATGSQEATVVSATPALLAGIETAERKWGEIKASLEQNLRRQEVADQRNIKAGDLVTAYQSFIGLKPAQPGEDKLAAEKQRYETSLAALQPLRAKLVKWQTEYEQNTGNQGMQVMIGKLMRPLEADITAQEAEMLAEHKRIVAEIEAAATAAAAVPSSMAKLLAERQAEVQAAQAELAEIEAERQKLTGQAATVQADLEKLAGQAGEIARRIEAIRQEIGQEIV